MNGDKAIEVLRESIRTHEDWRNYFERNPEKQTLSEYKNLGGFDEQKERIKEYQQSILEIQQLQAKIEKMEKRLRWLNALEAAGVEYWEGFENAKEIFKTVEKAFHPQKNKRKLSEFMEGGG